MKTGKLIVVILLVSILMAGCGSKATPTQAPPPTAINTPVQATEEIAVATPTPELPPTPTNTPEPVRLTAEVNAARLNMRTGPSILHDILNQYEKGDSVTVIGAAPGKEWLKVIAKDGKVGWIYVTFVTINGEVSLLPVLPISESLTAVGKVVDANGKGLPGIQIGLTRVGGATMVRVEGITLSDGTVYLYAPIEYQGTWLASIIGVNCTSQIVDSNCRYAGKFLPAEGIRLKLPQDTEIKFTYQ